MAINEPTQDSINNPGNIKTVTLDIIKNVFADSEGDEQYSLTLTTTATSKISGDVISNAYIRDVKVGYSKSKKVTGPFTIDGTNNQLQVSIDGSPAQIITLASGTSLTPKDIADNLQSQLSGLGGVGAPLEGDLGFLNASVDYIDGRFRILSGSISDTYTGAAKSSVAVTSGSNDAAALLGFDIPIESEDLASKVPGETIVTSSFTASGTTLQLETVNGYNANEAYTITDGTNREYFIADAVASGTGQLTVASGAITNSYGVGSTVQKIFERDPDNTVASPFNTVDDIMRFSLKNIVNQINFTI